MTPTLLFIDTNIFLDFYRQVGWESDLSILKHIGQHHDRIITTRQVEMEFKKNRPRVIANSLAAIKAPDWSGLNLPAYLATSRQASGLSIRRTQIKQLVETIQKRGRRIFEKPTQHDPVYKVVQRLFTANTPYNLSRSKEKEQKKALRLAWRRFLLGYPPRKATDTSIGDAVNWEWVLNCATQATANVVIVSRDSDYGVNLKGDGVYINDWLAQEFKERVNKRRNVTLTDRLSEGLKQISIRVTKKEAKAEEEFLQRDWLGAGLGSSRLGTLADFGVGVASPFSSPLSNILGADLGSSRLGTLADFGVGVASPFSSPLSNILGADLDSSQKHLPAAQPDDEEDND